MHEFDVPSTVTLAQVSRPAAAETREQAIIRLAAKAKIEGICLLTESSTEEVFATSSTMESIIYHVTAAGCSCMGFERFGRCKHWALYLVEIEQRLPPDPGAAAVAECRRLEALHARGRLKTTADLRKLQNARARVAELATDTMTAVA